jgi:hypothetical protein
VAGKVSEKKLEAASKLFRDFHGFDAKNMDWVPLDRSMPDALVKVGILKEIVYFSDKDSRGKLKRYIHDFSKPYPILCSDVAGKRLFIIGGVYEVKPEGIVH